MRSKAFIKENNTRRKIILTVILIITGLSFFYSYQSVRKNQQFKDQLVDITINNFRKGLNQHYINVADRYLEKINSLQLSSSFEKAIKTNDSTLFYNSIEPFISSIKPSLNHHIQLYSSEGKLVFGRGSKSIKNLSFKPVEKSLVFDSLNHKVSVCDDGLYHIVRCNINNGEDGYLELGISDRDGVKYLEDNCDLQIFTVLKNDIVKNQSQLDSYFIGISNGYSIFPYGETDLIEKIITNNLIEPQKSGISKTIKIDDKFYQLVKTGDFIESNKSAAGAAYAIVDVTKFESSFRSFLIRSILLSIFIIICSYILIRVFFNRLMERFFRIEEGFEREVAVRTKEILDTNIELNQIFNSTANGMRIINKNYEIIRVNDAFCRISGIKREGIEGGKCYEIFPGLYCHTSNCPLDRISQGETAIETEEVRFKKGGKKIQCLHTAVPFLGKDGEYLGIIEDFKDISERYEVEHTLKRTEEQFSSFMDSLPVGVFIKNSKGVIIYQNTYLKRVLATENYLGKDFSNEQPNDWEQKISEDDEKALQIGKIEFEETIIDKEGKERTFVTNKFRFRGVDNEWKIGGVSIDVTNKKNTEHYLYVLSKAIKNSPVSIVITNTNGVIEFINPSFTRLTGYSQSDAIQQNLLNMKVEFNSGNNLSKAIESIRNGEVWKGEMHLQNVKGSHFWVIASFAPIYNRKGEVAHAVISMEDITLRKENERELLLSKTKAEESDRLKTAFLSNLSHEIRTPLNAIIGFSSLMNDSDLSFAEKKNLSDVIYKNSNDLLKLIENLIEISEIEAGQLNIKKSECFINKLLLELQESFLEEDRKGKAVKLNLRKEVRSDDFTILTDPIRLKQILSNLISNACKFTERGFIEFGYAFKDENNIVFYVIDTGIGIDPEKQKSIFSPFRQADDSNTRRFSGMGLGLAISKHIVEKLGGKIWLTSTPGSGSTFFFTIPYIPVRFKFEPEPKESKKSIYNWKNKKILVADDIDANYVYLKAAIKQTAAEVIWAKNGQEAVDYVKNDPSISLVLMDIVMPDMDGFEATRQIKQHNNKLPVVCQTAYPSNENYQAGNACGFDSFMAKPIKVDGMLQVIDKLIAQN